MSVLDVKRYFPWSRAAQNVDNTYASYLRSVEHRRVVSGNFRVVIPGISSWQSRVDQTWFLEHQGALVKIRHQWRGRAPLGGGARGQIKGFSDTSRKRLIDMMARLAEPSDKYQAVFLTLTYSDDAVSGDWRDAEHHRRVFIKRVMRRFPDSGIIWRREWKARQSGRFKGKYLPHYHLIIFNMPFWDKVEIESEWSDIVGAKSWVEIHIANNRKRLMRYTSKYAAKLADQKEVIDRETGEGNLVNVSYMTAGSCGRAWGVCNRSKMKYADRKIIALPAGDWVESVREAAGRIYDRARDGRGDQGFTLYVEKSFEWFERFLSMYLSGDTDLSSLHEFNKMGGDQCDYQNSA